MTLSERQSEYIKCATDPLYYLNNYGYVFDAQKQRVNKMTCFEYQEDCVFKFHKYRNNVVLKSRQCLPENTFVDTPNGPKAIQDFKIGDELYSFNLETNELEIDKIKDAWVSGERQCVKFKLQDTRNFEVGENHPFFIKGKGWVKAGELNRGDEIIDINLGFGNKHIDENEVKILSYLITDGCTLKQVKFTNNNLKYLQEFEQSANFIFPDLEIRKVKKLKGFDYYPHQKHGESTKSSIMEWCERYGIANKKTEQKLLPNDVFNWDKESVSLLINRMFAGDGWISIYKKKLSNRLELGIASPSLFLMEQIKSLLKKFNIKCNIYEVKNMKLQKNIFYKLRITHSKSAIKFVREIGIFDKVRDEHFEICENYKHDVKNSSIIKKIEKTDVKKCFDISVEKNENFLINGLLTHNTGLSVITAGYVAWRIIFRKDEKILIIANDGDGAVRFLAAVKQFVEYTPTWLLPGSDGKPLTNNQKEIVLKNKSFAKAKASSPEAGRGEALTLLVLDETAFIENADTIWMAAGLALSATHGKCIMVSTPNGTSNLYHNIWTEAEKKQSTFEPDDFVPTRVHWKQNPYCAEGIELREDESGEKVYWSPWYEGECKRMQYDKVKIAQELDLSFEGSKYLAIENELISKYDKRLLLPEYQLIDKNKTYYDYKNKPGERFVNYETSFTIFKPYIPGHKYILGGDVARGDGTDYSTIEIIDIETLEVVAEYRDKIAPDLFAHVIYNVGMDYGEAYLVVECNSFGLATAIDLSRKMNYKRMHYSKNIQEIIVRPYNYKVEENETIPGFQTTKKTRPLVVNNIRTHLREGTLKIYSKFLMNEFKTFIQKGDRPEAEKGKNDDLIFALGIGLFIRDTEYQNAAASAEMYKGMLDAIGYVSKTINGTDFSSNPASENISDIPPDAGGIFFNDFSSQRDNKSDDFNDIDWLLSPTSKKT